MTLQDEQKLMRRRAPTRALKQVADMQLLAGLCGEAHAKYVQEAGQSAFGRVIRPVLGERN
jgi:hypothetical protein